MATDSSHSVVRAPASFVIPVFNGEKYVAEAIDSCLAQTWAPEKIVVVDDASTDGTHLLLERFHNEHPTIVDPVFLSENGGRSVACNAGIARVTSPYCLFLDADDISEPDRIEKQVRFMDDNPDVFASSGFVRYIDQNGRVFASGSLSVLSRNDYAISMSSGSPIGFFSPATIVRTSVFKKDGLWFRPIFRQAQDIDLWNRIAEKHVIFAHPDFVTRYRIHEDAVSTKKYLRSQFFFAYICDCVARRRSGREELPMEAFSDEWNRRPLWKRLFWRISVESRRHFRQSGFSFAERRYAAFIWHLASSFLLNPKYAFSKLRGKINRGNRHEVF